MPEFDKSAQFSMNLSTLKSTQQLFPCTCYLNEVLFAGEIVNSYYLKYWETENCVDLITELIHEFSSTGKS